MPSVPSPDALPAPLRRAGHSAPVAPPPVTGAALCWQDEARRLATTHTLREASQEIGVAYETLRSWASGAGVAFLPPDPIPAPEPVLMDDDARRALLGHFYAAELGTTPRRLMDRRLWALTSRPEPVRDVAAALAKLEGRA